MFALGSGSGAAWTLLGSNSGSAARPNARARLFPLLPDGRPTGPSNHVFMIGLIGAWLSLGELPTMTAVLQYFRPPAVAEAGGEQEIEQEGEGSGRDHVAQEIAKDSRGHIVKGFRGRVGS